MSSSESKENGGNPPFTGMYGGKALDEKRRFFYPKALKNPSLTQAFTLVAHPNQPCIIAYYREKPAFDEPTRSALSAFAYAAEPDSSGRILLNQPLAEHIKAPTGGKKITLVGRDAYFEIWTDDEWKKVEAERKREAAAALESAL